MNKLPINPDQHYCCCGALCGPANTRCRKCRDRLRWYRRKAWRINPMRRERNPGKK